MMVHFEGLDDKPACINVPMKRKKYSKQKSKGKIWMHDKNFNKKKRKLLLCQIEIHWRVIAYSKKLFTFQQTIRRKNLQFRFVAIKRQRRQRLVE
jgi:hypothetical protein